MNPELRNCTCDEMACYADCLVCEELDGEEHCVSCGCDTCCDTLSTAVPTD